MTSRDERASYYDLDLPDGTRTEVWSVLRAVLSPEEALGYAKACILTRIMRDGRKDVDRMREAEKVGIEAGMLREAMEAYLATDQREMVVARGDGVTDDTIAIQRTTGAPMTADKADLLTATEAAQRFTDDAWRERLTQIRPDGWLRWVPDIDRIAELERELREARHEASRERELTTEKVDMVRDLGSDLVGARRELAEVRKKLSELERERDKAREGVLEVQREYNNLFDLTSKEIRTLKRTLDTERQAAVATAEELERVRRELLDLRKERAAANALLATIRDEAGVSAAHEAPAEIVRVKAALRTECERLDSEIRVGRELRSRIVDLERELVALRARYRPRRQSEEPAPEGASVLRWVSSPWVLSAPRWVACHEQELLPGHTWTYQPPAPGEGE